jgi:hypothetical protein
MKAVLVEKRQALVNAVGRRYERERPLTAEGR